MRRVVRFASCGVLWLLSLSAIVARGEIVDFEELSPAPYYNGSDSAGGFTSGGATFNNAYDTTYGTWGGWAYSRETDSLGSADTSQADYTYQYSAASGSGSRQSANYAVGYVDPYTPTTPKITLPEGVHPLSIQVSNNTYTAISMRDGDDYAKQFSGPVGDQPGDWFKLTVTGLDASNQPIGSVDQYLADFRAPGQHFILDSWANLNLSSLYDARALEFTLTSSDSGIYGMNTPAYFAADDLSLTRQAGDVNGDNVVNGLDIAAVAAHWLQSGPQADTNGDGVVNGLDIAAIAANWLHSSPGGGGTGASAAVPEPATGLLLLLGAGVYVFTRARRGS